MEHTHVDKVVTKVNGMPRFIRHNLRTPTPPSKKSSLQEFSSSKHLWVLQSSLGYNYKHKSHQQESQICSTPSSVIHYATKRESSLNIMLSEFQLQTLQERRQIQLLATLHKISHDFQFDEHIRINKRGLSCSISYQKPQPTLTPNTVIQD